MDHYIAIAIALAVGLFVYELYVWLPFICSWLLHRACRKLPGQERARYYEEWMAHLDAMPNSLARLISAVGFRFAARRLHRKTVKEEIGAIFSAIYGLVKIYGRALYLLAYIVFIVKYEQFVLRQAKRARDYMDRRTLELMNLSELEWALRRFKRVEEIDRKSNAFDTYALASLGLLRADILDLRAIFSKMGVDGLDEISGTLASVDGLQAKIAESVAKRQQA